MHRYLKRIVALAMTLTTAAALLPLAAEAAPGKKSNSPGASCQTTTVSGVVTSWKYNRPGEVDGFYLDSGLEVKFPPYEAVNVDAIIDVGSSVSVNGCQKTGPAGDTHMKATTITNLDTSASYTLVVSTPATNQSPPQHEAPLPPERHEPPSSPRHDSPPPPKHDSPPSPKHDSPPSPKHEPRPPRR